MEGIDEVPTVGDPIQFAFPKLVKDNDEELRQAYFSNVDIMAKKQHRSPDFWMMWDYLKSGTLPAKTHTPGRTIQAIDALSQMPSENKLLADHPNLKELKRPLVLNVPVHCPSVSDIFLDAQEAAG